jgi:hypothetical protein
MCFPRHHHRSWFALPLMIVLFFVLAKGFFFIAPLLGLLALAAIAFKVISRYEHYEGKRKHDWYAEDDQDEKPKRAPRIIVANRDDDITYV